MKYYLLIWLSNQLYFVDIYPTIEECLYQGNSLLNIREGLLNNIISAGREGFDTSRFTKMGKREKKLINSEHKNK